VTKIHRFSAAVIIAAAVGLTAAAAAPRPAAASCEELARVALPDTQINAAESIAGPTFTPPGGRTLNGLPPFCRVTATSAPAIRFEVWLPAGNWNGKFQGVGNGANAGSISFDAMATALRRGYAVASTDTGHATENARDARWAMGHPELVADFGHRALHVTTQHAKSIVRDFYGKPADHSYYVGCSTGGRQGLMEAQRYPEDYDGLIAGAPAANWTRFQTGGHLWVVLSLNKDPESYVPTRLLPIIERAVNNACDALDGVTDGILDDPRRCSFDAQSLVCASGQDASTCLTPKQAIAVNRIWTGPRNSRGEQVYPPYMRGAESAGGWETYSTATGPLSGSHWVQATNVMKYMVFENPAWDFRTFDYDRDVAYTDRKLASTMNAFDPDLSGLRKRSGKLLLYHGWNDPSISPLNTVNYFESAVARWRDQEGTGPDASPDFIRLFMVPGMLHCSGGPGADKFDALTALERWVERDEPPNVLPAAHMNGDVPAFTRPLCAYPDVAIFSGRGDQARAENFSCGRRAR
jgi:feruloyl esterase